MTPFLWALPEELAATLRERATRRDFAVGAHVHRIGTRADGVYELVRGRVRMERLSHRGRPLTLTLLFAGSWFGDLASLLDGPRTDDAVAETALTVNWVRRAAFLEVLQARPALQFQLLQVMAQRLQVVLASVEDTSLSTLPQRLAGKLLGLDEAMRRSGEAGPLPVTQQRLGELLGVTRENVARVLAKWGKAGVVENLHGRLALRDRAALERLRA